jgi:ABC-2 type transport system ATP-binding protein/teichoic acid transport system ATP-binding protein
MSEPLHSVSDLSQRQRPTPAEPAVVVDNVSASYHVRLDAGWRSGLSDMLRRRHATARVVPALRDISFEIPRGTVLGVIGRNGAGKSTLLRTIAGILAPEEGRVTVRGRISALLAPGVGMNDMLTGRENIILCGLAMGLSRQRLMELTESIAGFAELGEYIDFPVRTYSSGMRMRLAFSVVAHLDPEILLIDETLTGGDAKFQEKTAAKMFELCGGGRTIVLVSHGLSAIRMMATTALWLHQGKTVALGDTDEVVDRYMRYCRIEASRLEWDEP